MKNRKLDRGIRSSFLSRGNGDRKHTVSKQISSSGLANEKKWKNNSKATPFTSSTGLDSVDISIIKELIEDPKMKSGDIAAKIGIPLSTIQRRRAVLESSSILHKTYELDLAALGWREADLLITVEKGRCRDIARRLLRDFKYSVKSSTLRIGDPEVNVVAEIIYKSSPELLEIVENVKNMDLVSFVEWSEITEVVGRNNIDVKSLFGS
jgi:DNA-binding Lrp family transcriptional regulator